MIDLLVEKVDVFREKLKITLRYTPQAPNHTPPKGKTENSDTDNDPDGNSPDRGHLFIQYTAHYTQTKKGRKSTRCLGNYFAQTNRNPDFRLTFSDFKASYLYIFVRLGLKYPMNPATLILGGILTCMCMWSGHISPSITSTPFHRHSVLNIYRISIRFPS